MSSTARASATDDVVTMGQVLTTWWPLAASWVLMSAEQPAIAAVIARLTDPEINLAAWGGVVFAFALVIESPIIMVLAASTELVRDRASYARLSRFVHTAGALLTGLHVLLVATPLYGWVIGDLLGVPDGVADIARPALAVALPWTWSIAWRRFNQGILIRFGQSRAVGVGSALRLGSNAAALWVGWYWQQPGVLVAATALVIGVVTEGLYVGLRARPVIARHLQADDPAHPPLVGRAFWAFYIPLAMTPLVALAVQPLGTAALTRMPMVLPSMAVWPVINGLSFMLVAPGLAFNEVVVALWRRPGARRVLARFVALLCLAGLAAAVLLAATPLGHIWLVWVNGLSAQLVELAEVGLWFLLFIPVSRALQSWFQGVLVATRRTRGISEAVFVFGLVSAALLGASVQWPVMPGLYGALGAFVMGRVAQTVHLGWRCGQVLRELRTAGSASA